MEKSFIASFERLSVCGFVYLLRYLHWSVETSVKLKQANKPRETMIKGNTIIYYYY